MSLLTARRRYLLTGGLSLLGTSIPNLWSIPAQATSTVTDFLPTSTLDFPALVGPSPLPIVLASTVRSESRKKSDWILGQEVIPPDLRLFDNTLFTANKARGKLLLIEFWASWCPYCSQQNPHIESLYRRYQKQGLMVLGISIDKQPKAAIDYIKKQGLTFPNGIINPAWGDIFKAHGKVPLVYVLNPRGKIIQIQAGEMLKDDIDDISELL